MKKKPIQNDAIEKVEEITVEKSEKTTRPLTRRYNKHGKRRGKYGYAAPLGMLISLLAVVGVVALVFGGIAGVQKLTDTTELKEELYYFLEPVMAYTPAPFENINEAEEQDAFINAAAYRISLAEQLRMLLENDESSRYSVDESGRIVVPVAEMEESYAALFGPNAPLTHRTLSDDTVSYSESDGCYYVPFESINSGYEGVVDTVKRRGNTYIVRVGYVNITDIQLDEHGNQQAPAAADATLFQTFTLEKTDTGYIIKACADE